jgi:hypothetical protein
MNISMIIWTIVAILIFRFLTKYILPVLRITKMTSERMRQMQEQMNDMNQKVEAKKTTSARPNKSDYIDYEEIK